VTYRSPPTSKWRKLAAFLICFCIFAPMGIVSLATPMIGRCDSDGNCEPILTYLLFFPGLLTAALIGALVMTRWASKDDF